MPYSQKQNSRGRGTSEYEAIGHRFSIEAPLRMENAPKAVRETYRTYFARRTENERDENVRHLSELCQLMWQFGDGGAGDKLNPFVYDATMLGMIFDNTPEESRLKPEVGRDFRCAWKTYVEHIRKLYASGESDWFNERQTITYPELPLPVDENPYRREYPLDITACEPSPESELTYTMDLLRHRDNMARLEYEFQRRLARMCKLSKKKPVKSLGDWALQQPEVQSVDETFWSTTELFADPDRMNDILHCTNMETVPTRAIEALHYLNRIAQVLSDDTKSLDMKASLNNETTFRQVMFAQEALGPLADTQGFEALTIALDGAAKEIRLNFGTDEDRRALALARRIKQDLPPAAEINSLVENALGSILFDTIAEPLIKGDDIGEKVIYGEGVLQQTDSDKEQRLRYRVKSDGSLGWKIKTWAEREAKNTNRTVMEVLDEIEQQIDDVTPMDIVGVTVMAQDEDEQRAIFGQMMKNALSNADMNIDLKASPSRKHAIQIRGTREFQDDFRKYLLSIGLTNEQLEDDENSTTAVIQWSPKEEKRSEYTREDLHIAKITFYYLSENGALLPMEIQCITERYRIEMRYKKIAHWLFKAGEVDKVDDSKILKESESCIESPRRVAKKERARERSQKAIEEFGRRKEEMRYAKSINKESAAESWDWRQKIEKYVET